MAVRWCVRARNLWDVVVLWLVPAGLAAACVYASLQLADRVARSYVGVGKASSDAWTALALRVGGEKALTAMGEAPASDGEKFAAVRDFYVSWGGEVMARSAIVIAVVSLGLTVAGLAVDSLRRGRRERPITVGDDPKRLHSIDWSLTAQGIEGLVRDPEGGPAWTPLDHISPAGPTLSRREHLLVSRVLRWGAYGFLWPLILGVVLPSVLLVAALGFNRYPTTATEAMLMGYLSSDEVRAAQVAASFQLRDDALPYLVGVALLAVAGIQVHLRISRRSAALGVGRTQENLLVYVHRIRGVRTNSTRSWECLVQESGVPFRRHWFWMPCSEVVAIPTRADTPANKAAGTGPLDG